MTSSFEFYTSNLDRHLQESSSQNLISAAEHHLLFASEYYLKPKGVDYVQKEFKCQLDLLDLQDSLVKFKYDPEKYNFLITCSPGKSHNVWKIFHAIMTKMVREECQKSIRLHKYEDSIESTDGDSSCDDEYECYDEDLVLESDKIGRVGICEAQAQQSNLSVPSPICISTFSNISNQVDDQNFKYTYCWEDRVLKINDVFTDSVLQELSSLTGCTFIKEPNDCRIYIKSDLEASLNKGISKMDNIKNYFLPQNKIPVYHSFYTESEPNSQFAFLRISNSKNRIFKTTLIDNLSSKIGADEIKDLQDLIQDAVIIRYASFDRVSAAFQIRWKLKVVPIVKEEEKNLVSKSCRNPIYPLKDAHQEAHDLFGINQYKTRNSISRENHKEFVDIKKKLNLSSKNPQISNWVQDVVDSDSLKAEREGIEPTTTKLKNPPGKKKGPTSYDLANRFKDAPQSTIRESPKNELVLKKLRSSLISSKDKTEKAPINPKVKFEQETPRDFWSRHPGKFSVDLTDIKVNQQQQSKSVDLRLVANKIQASNLIDDFIPELSCNIPKPKKEKMISEIKNRDTLLIDFEEDTSIPTSTYTFSQADVSRNEEVLLHLPKLDIKQPPIQSKKKEGRNKNKKSAHAGLPLLDSTREIKESTVFDILSSNQETHILESFKQSFKSNFRSLMKNIRAFRGELVVEAHFGRTMTHGIKDIYISKKGEYEKTYDEETTRRILNESKSNSLTPGFTKVITTVPAEIQFIREMKDCHGLNCWSQEKTDWSLYYELYFEDRNFSHNNNFIVEINAQSFVCRAKTISELGNLYVHGTTRLWDFRVAATDIKYTDRLDIEHSELVEMISTSLFIPEICSLSSIKFEIKEPLNKRYHLEKALTRHIDKYLSRDNQSILQISEIQSLEILKRNFLNKKLIIKAFFTDCLESNSSQLLRLWFEVSVSSTSLNIELAKNQKLELGELADWSVDDLTFSSIANSIYLPACWILERIDGVGSYNDNGFDIQESFLSTTTDKPEILPYYW